MHMRAPTGLLVTLLAVGCFEENDPVTTTPGMDGSTSGTGTADSASMTGSGSGSGPTGSGPTTDPDPSTGATSDPTDSADSTTGDPPVGVCEDGTVTPGELCLGELTVLTSNNEIVAVQIGDVSGSAAADIVYLIPDQVVVRVGDGNGNFGNPVFDEALMGRSFELVDLSGDGELDIVAIADGGPLVVLHGNGGGGFDPADLEQMGPDPRALALGDLDGGGTLDAVVGTGGAGMLFTALGDGGGGFGTSTSFVAFGSVGGVALADFTGDGNLDVALTIQGGSIEGVALRPGDGSGGLLDQRVTSDTMSGAMGLATGDFDADGNPDLAYVSNTEGMLAVLLGDGSGGFAPEQIYAVGPEPTLLIGHDLTLDGREDLVVAHDGVPELWIFTPLSDGTLPEPTVMALAASVTSLDAGDVNGDGAPDVAAASRAQQIVSVLYSTP